MSYVGRGTVPPAYPETTDFTPGTRSKTASRHQKQPPPKVARSSLGVFLSASPSLAVFPASPLAASLASSPEAAPASVVSVFEVADLSSPARAFPLPRGWLAPVFFWAD